MFVTNIQFYCLKLIIMMTKNKGSAELAGAANFHNEEVA